MSNAAAADLGLVGSTCTTLTVIGLPLGKSCVTNQTPVCCTDDSYVRYSPLVVGSRSRLTELLAERDREPWVFVYPTYVRLERNTLPYCYKFSNPQNIYSLQTYLLFFILGYSVQIELYLDRLPTGKCSTKFPVGHGCMWVSYANE